MSTSSSAPNRRIAIILVGHVRTWKTCADSFNKAFSRFNNADVYLATYDVRYGHHPYVKGSIGDYGDETVTLDKIKLEFENTNTKLVSIDYEVQSEVDLFIRSELEKVPDSHKHASTLSQYRKLKRAIEMVQQYEKDHVFKYDFIIKTRCDLTYNDEWLPDAPHNDTVEDKTIIISDGNVYPNDCFMYGRRDHMVQIAEFIQQELYNPIYADSHLNPPHNFVKNAVLHYGLVFQSMNIIKSVIRKGEKEFRY